MPTASILENFIGVIKSLGRVFHILNQIIQLIKYTFNCIRYRLSWKYSSKGGHFLPKLEVQFKFEKI